MATAEFNKLANEAASHREKDDCAVKAIALVTGLEYKDALELAAQFGRKPRKGMQTLDIIAAIESIGFKLLQINSKTFIEQYKKSGIKNVTTHHPERFNEVWKDGSKYLFFVKGHVAAVIDGVTHDWTQGKSKLVKKIYKVEKA